MKLNKEQKISILTIIVSIITAIASNEIRCLAGLACKCYIDRQSFQGSLSVRGIKHGIVTDTMIIEDFWRFLFFLMLSIAMFIFSVEENMFDQDNRISAITLIFLIFLFAVPIIAMIYGVKC